MTEISLYAILRGDGNYFAGFDASAGAPLLVESIVDAKFFTNKFDINLRPDEMMVEVIVPLLENNLTVSEPFKPKRRSDRFPPDRYYPSTPLVNGGKRATD